MKKLYKILEKNLKSPFQNFNYELNKKYHCWDFNEDKTEDCSKGFYAVDIDGLPYCYNTNRIIVETDVWGKEVEYNVFKRRYENIKIIREVPKDEILQKIKNENWDEKLGYKISAVINPFNPFTIDCKKITENEIILLKNWDSVRASVRASIWDSVSASVRDSVRDSVRASVRASIWDSVSASIWDSVSASVRDSVRASVRASIWDSVSASIWDSVSASVRASIWDSILAYYSFLFTNIKKWEHIVHKEGENPFQPCIDLFYRGLIPAFDGRDWYLVSKNGIELKISKEDLIKEM